MCGEKQEKKKGFIQKILEKFDQKAQEASEKKCCCGGSDNEGKCGE